jgi:DNA repair protein RadC
MTVIEAAIRAKADKVIMVHNHPSGVAAPSRHDLETTSEIKSMFRELGIVLADHIIITEDDYLSLASLPKFSTFFI